MSPERAKAERAVRRLRRVEREKRAAERKTRLVNRPDPKASFGALRQREPRERDKPYLAYLGRQRCFRCALEGRQQSTRTEATHPKFGIGGKRREFGLSEKSHDRFAVPLCGDCHQTGPTAEHKGQRAFWDRLGTPVDDVAARYYAAFKAGREGADIIAEFARKS